MRVSRNKDELASDNHVKKVLHLGKSDEASRFVLLLCVAGRAVKNQEKVTTLPKTACFRRECGALIFLHSRMIRVRCVLNRKNFFSGRILRSCH